jgi:menaquinol-cytochrome c reductase iron-sulfur subunit
MAGSIHGNDVRENTPAINRRSFFGALLAIGSAGIGALLSVPVLRYVLFPLNTKSKKDEWSVVGNATDFSNLKLPVQKTLEIMQRDGWREVASSQSVYVTHGTDGAIKVLSSICPHLGCTVSWQKAQSEFVCPCHGGRFAPDGKYVSGPPPRGMDPLPSKVKDGKLMVKMEYFRSDVPNREVLG